MIADKTHSVIKAVLQHLPQHQTWVDICGGNIPVAFAKPPSPVDVYNDVGNGLVNLYRVLRSKRAFRRFFELAKNHHGNGAVLSRDWRKAKRSVLRAYLWFCHMRQALAFPVCVRPAPTTPSVQRQLSSVKGLFELHHRMMRMQVEAVTPLRAVEVYDTPRSVLYGELAERDDELLEKLCGIVGCAVLVVPASVDVERLGKAGWKGIDVGGGMRLWLNSRCREKVGK